MLLDGARGSFIMTAGDDPELSRQATEWTWSANVRHALVIQTAERRLYISRWDTRKPQGPFNMPVSATDAELVFHELQRDDAMRRGDVISWVMQGFRQVRSAIGDPVVSLLVLNGLLLVAREVAQGTVHRHQVQDARTFSDAMALLRPEMRTSAGLDGLAEASLDRSFSSIGTYFLDQDPFTGHCLCADLLFRHAASDLYQEAHLEIERSHQGYLFQFEPLQAPDIRSGPRDVRYTPANLARTLVEQAIRFHGSIPTSLTVLDPACGSGIFLQEVARELNANPPANLQELHILGFDTSEIAKSVTESCLHLTRMELPSRFSIDWSIEKADALITPWRESDLILMNPPFRTWRDMSDGEKENVRRVLGENFFGRPDVAQAFLWKAVQSLRPGGCLATVLPVALLDSRSGSPLREAIRSIADLMFIGRFEGFSYFSSSLVETAFIILRRRTDGSSPSIDVLIAAEGFEDAALRSLRGTPAPPAVERFQIPPLSLSASSWIPRRRDDFALLQSLDRLNLTSCGDLFAIHQGIRTGDNEAFVLTSDDWSLLPAKERAYFRRAAGQGTIRDGQLLEGEFVFYPYAPGGPILQSEDELRRRAPRYYARWLEPRESVLRKRAGAREWWLPTRPRGWSYERSSKLVSTYFGKPGSFAYDEQGDYVVLQGFAWLWKKAVIMDDDREERTFDETLYPFAYLALLNSDVFERILSCFSWRMQGGQFNLEAKFLSDVPLPDLTDDTVVSRSTTERLAALGRSICEGGFHEVRDKINQLVGGVYTVAVGP
jgi:hypothetical protein